MMSIGMTEIIILLFVAAALLFVGIGVIIFVVIKLMKKNHKHLSNLKKCKFRDEMIQREAIVCPCC
jgi:large-conductance mechanosensitive channel